MRGPTHDRSVLAQFQNGEERLVYARRKNRPDEPPTQMSLAAPSAPKLTGSGRRYQTLDERRPHPEEK